MSCAFANCDRTRTEGRGGTAHSYSMWHRCAGCPSPGFPPRIGVQGMLSIAGMTRVGIYSRINRPCRLVPARQGMKSGSCGLVQRIGTADCATPHPDPSGGQAPALHFLIPPSAISLQFGRIRPWRAGIEVDWRAHPGSESGTCFHSNR